METFFLKSKDLYLRQELLYDKLEDINLSESEIKSIYDEIDKIDDEIIVDYPNLFFSEIENDAIFYSKQECLDWIDNPKNLVKPSNYVFDGKELNEEQSKLIVLNRLDKFWEIYSDGLIIISRI